MDSQRSGNRIIRRSTARDERKYGSVPQNPSSILIPLILEASRRHNPYGGVTKPSASVTMIIRPRMIGLIFSATADGRMIGTKRIMAGTASINVPTNMKNRTTTSRNSSAPVRISH